MSKEVFGGTREEWLKSEKYIFEDIYSDNFALNFETVTIKQLLKNGVKIEEPEFVELII